VHADDPVGHLAFPSLSTLNLPILTVSTRLKFHLDKFHLGKHQTYPIGNSEWQCMSLLVYTILHGFFCFLRLKSQSMIEQHMVHGAHRYRVHFTRPYNNNPSLCHHSLSPYNWGAWSLNGLLKRTKTHLVLNFIKLLAINMIVDSFWSPRYDYDRQNKQAVHFTLINDVLVFYCSKPNPLVYIQIHTTCLHKVFYYT
jgi:hypothetical protein